MINEDIITQFRKYVLDVYPNEGVGVVIDNKFVPCENISQTPKTKFAINTNIFLQRPTQLLHSHIITRDHNIHNDPRTPSYSDVKNFIKTNIPWGIVSTDGEHVSTPLWLSYDYDRPLIGREFIPYINDCYTLFRDWYWQNKQLRFAFYPDIDWGQEIPSFAYYDRLQEYGFREISLSDVQYGDLILMDTKNKYDHGGVYLGDNKVLHHITGRLSGVWDTGKLRPFISAAARYYGD